MLRILLLCLLFVGLYRFITRILFPVLRIGNAVRGQMKQMQRDAQHNSYPGHAPAKSRNTYKGDYIDYEEVR